MMSVSNIVLVYPNPPLVKGMGLDFIASLFGKGVLIGVKI
jgi:hypothetical protein